MKTEAGDTGIWIILWNNGCDPWVNCVTSFVLPGCIFGTAFTGTIFGDRNPSKSSGQLCSQLKDRFRGSPD